MAPQSKLTTNQPTKKKIFFNSKVGKKYKLLSNFYGPAEFNFHMQRFKGEVLPNLLRKVYTSTHKDANRFLAILKQLQPHKKTWTERKERHWFNEDRPIVGILAKIIMNKCKRISVRSSGWKKDLIVLRSVAKDFGIEVCQGDFALHGPSEDVTFMRRALLKKYSKGKYRNLLLSTGDAVLHEFGRRPSRWTFTKSGEGGNLLGKLLTEVRDKIARE